jgi:AraC-like DNA-binding protein
MPAIPLTGFFNTIILLGAIQGFIISSLLFFSKKYRQPNRILAVLILLISLACFNLYGNYQNWFNSDLLRFISDLVPLVIVMPFGPLVYFYVQSILEPGFKINKKKRRHFYPVVIDLVPSMTVIVFIVGLITKLVKNNPGPWGVFIDNYNVYADIPRWMSVTFYVWLSAKYLSAYKLKNVAGLNGHALHFKWLQQFIRVFMVFQVIWLAYLVPYVIPKYTNIMLDTFDWYPIYIPMAILIYWLGIKGYLISQQQVVIDKKVYANNAILSPELIKQVIAELTRTMKDDKTYLNPNLNLAVMAETTGFAQKAISAVINQHLQKSFNEFVNGYRVNEFKVKILQPEMNNLTIAGIAFECGFNSQATFQRTFKELTGQSPSEYRKTAQLLINQ